MELQTLIHILTQDKPSEIIKNREEEIFAFIPELAMCKGFNQNTIWHPYDVYEHILHVVDSVDNHIVLRMAALFHDIGKPFTYTQDANGVGHFYGHWNKSKEIFDAFAEKNNMEENKRNLISNLILYHDLNIAKIREEQLNQLIHIFTKEDIIMLFQLKRSDLFAQNEKFHYLLADYDNQQEKVLSKQREI